MASIPQPSLFESPPLTYQLSIPTTSTHQAMHDVRLGPGGSLVLAGRDVHHHDHHTHYCSVELRSVLSLVPNLRKLHADISSRATPGTGLWILRCRYFSIWLDPNGNLKIMWGSGIPGAGKTVLASIVSSALQERAKALGSEICIGFLYMRYSDHSRMTVRDFLEILVKQTVERHPTCLPLFDKLYASHIREETPPTEQELLDLLQSFTRNVSATYYVLEALDEAPRNMQFDLLSKLASLDVKLFVTSRHLRALETEFPDAHCFSIVAQDHDLDVHISKRISTSRHLSALVKSTGEAWKQWLISSIKSKCEGMFLHVSLQLDALQECTTIFDCQETLEEFPRSIEAVYLQTCERILDESPRNVLKAKVILLWVLNAMCPLTVEQLQRAVATQLDTFKFVSTRDIPESTLVSLCHSLVIIDEESRLVRLIHYTAKASLERFIAPTFPHPHSLLATISMTLLKEAGFQAANLDSTDEFKACLQPNPLLAYAHQSWALHASKSLDDEQTVALLSDFVSGSQRFPVLHRREPRPGTMPHQVIPA